MSTHPYCPRCRADVLPTRRGTCGFCDGPLLTTQQREDGAYSVARAAICTAQLATSTGITRAPQLW